MLCGMQNMTEITTTIATAAQEDALRRQQSQRLKDLAEGLLQAFETLEMPKEHGGIEKAAKALVSLNKLMKTLYEAKTSMAKQPATVTGPGGAPIPEPVDEAEHAEALASWLPGINEKLKTMARNGRIKRTLLKAAEVWPQSTDV